MIFDAVIIGAGPSGLAAAARLAHFDIKVCVLEAHRRLGGLNSWHHVKGREISTGLHAFTNYSSSGRGGPLGKLLRQLRISHRDLNLRAQNQSSIRFPSATLRLSNDTELIRQQIAQVFPGQIDGFDRFRALIRDTDEGELTDRRSSAREVMAQYIDDPLLTDMLFCPVMYYGNPGGVGDGQDAGRELPDMDWLLFCVLWKCIFETGLGYPAAGMRPLWEMLAARIVDDGGVIRMSSPVERLKTKNGRVTAAVLESGEEIEGGLFFSSAGAPETECLLSGEAESTVPPGTITTLEGISLLDGEAPRAGLDDSVVFFSFHDRLRFGCPPDELIDASGGVLCAPGNFVPAAGPDENIVKIAQLAGFPAWDALCPEDYGAAKQRIAGVLKDSLARLGVFPEKARNHGDGRFGVFDDIFTPITIFRYTGHVDGAIYGSPVKSRTGKTALPNLFLMGADQGFHGIVGAMLSGVAMVNLHLLTKHS